MSDTLAYTDEFFTITRKGHDRTTQTFGTPTLVWTVGLWPRWNADKPQSHNGSVRAILDHLNGVVRKLKPTGDRSQDEFAAEPPNAGGLVHLRSESVNFTVWWADAHEHAGDARPAQHDRTDLRVRVQMEVYPDFATVTFFLDAGKCWGEAVPLTAQTAVGERRSEIFRHVSAVTAVGERRTRDGVMGLDPLSEAGLADGEPEELLAAARYLYSDRDSDDRGRGGIWEDFCRAFDVHLGELAGCEFEVFVNLRGLVLAAHGRGDAKNPPDGEFFSRFESEDPDRGVSDEPNAIVHGYWPFIRRSRSEADFRDWIACGVLDGRGILVTSLGAQSQYTEGEEEHPAQMPAALPQRLIGNAGVVGDDRPAPFRYLMLTKGEPDRKQLGRMIDRVNTLSTLQLYAFKNWGVLRDANVLIRDHGRRLDDEMRQWVIDYQEFSSGYQSETAELIHRQRRQILEDVKPCAHLGVAAPPEFAFLRREPRDENELSPARRSRERRDARAERIRRSDRRFVKSSGQFNLHRRALDAFREEVEKIQYREKEYESRATGKAVAERRENLRVLADLLARLTAQAQECRGAKSEWDEELAEVNQTAEGALINIGDALDGLGRNAIGGIQFRINRSRYYAETYRHLLASMGCGNIETWWTYDQFSDRSVDPVFRQIDGIGQRLERLRDRLRSSMESVQTSAIVNQTEATRDNTFQMETIVRKLESLSLMGVELLREAKAARRRAEVVGRWMKALGVLFTVLGTLGVTVYLADFLQRLLGLK